MEYEDEMLREIDEETALWKDVTQMKKRERWMIEQIKNLKKTHSALTPQDVIEAKALALELEESFDESDSAASFIFLLKKKLKKTESFWTPARKRDYEKLLEEDDAPSDPLDRMVDYVSKLEMSHMAETFADKGHKDQIATLERMKDELLEQNVKFQQTVAEVGGRLKILVEEKKALEATVTKNKRKLEELEEYKTIVDDNARKMVRTLADKRERVRQKTMDEFDLVAQRVTEFREELTNIIEGVHAHKQKALQEGSTVFKELDGELSSYWTKQE